MGVLLQVVAAVVLVTPAILAAPRQPGALRLRPRGVTAVPAHTQAEWDDILANQTLGREDCGGCRPGTEPQHPLAGQVAGNLERGSGWGHGGRLGVINGHYADDEQFPWMASITMDSTWRCGGSLISDAFVLTAASCASGYLNFRVVLGDASLMFLTDTAHVAATYKALVHENYAEDTLQHDIALLQLLVPVGFTDAIRPVKLPAASDVANTFEGVTATISGWGETIYGYPAYNLMYVEQPVMANKRCARFLGAFVTASIICGDGAGHIGACGSDAGGALVVEDAKDTWKQVGIFSFVSDLGCTRGYPSAYTRVTEHLQWIQDKTNIQL